MSEICLRNATAEDRSEVAELICVSTNFWYQQHAARRVFQHGPESADVFWQVYDVLDPGCCVVAENPRSGRLMGSCFYHPREQHFSLGIMNVHPNYFGRGVARGLLKFVLEAADGQDYAAVRLVSSTLNLESFSLYTRAGFVPRAVYQDMLVRVPEAGLGMEIPDAGRIRPAAADDVPAMIAMEMEVSGICREKDYRYFIANESGYWQSLVYEGAGGAIEGFAFSSKTPSLCMIGPCIARSWKPAASLVLASLDRYRGGAAVFLVPVECEEMVRRMYGIGATNCELHFGQIRGRWQAPRGVSMPVFLPESA